MALRILFTLLILFGLGAALFITQIPTGYEDLLPKPVANMSNIYDSWQEYGPSTGKFKVKFPTIPLTSTETLALPNQEYKLDYEMYAANDNEGNTLMVTLINYPPEVELPINQEILKGVMEEMAQTTPQTKLQSQQMGQFLGNPSLDFTTISSQFNQRSIIFIKGQTLFVLTIVGKPENFDVKKFDYFVNSLKLM